MKDILLGIFVMLAILAGMAMLAVSVPWFYSSVEYSSGVAECHFFPVAPDCLKFQAQERTEK